MSSSYYFVCMECKTGILLGKSIYVEYPDYDVRSYGFSSIGTFRKDKDNSYAIETCEELQHFMMLHRCHELRVLPSDADRYAEHLGLPNSFPCFEDSEPGYIRENFFRSNMKAPDGKSEADALPKELVKKLKLF